MRRLGRVCKENPAVLRILRRKKTVFYRKLSKKPFMIRVIIWISFVICLFPKGFCGEEISSYG